jgi:hypothetical protein
MRMFDRGQLAGRLASHENQVMPAAELPLTCQQLALLLEAEGYPSASYGIGRHGKYLDQAFVVDRWSSRWVVYYTERGVKFDIRKHVSEDAACRDLLARLRVGVSR